MARNTLLEAPPYPVEKALKGLGQKPQEGPNQALPDDRASG